MGTYESPKPNRTVPCLIIGCLGAIVVVVGLVALIAYAGYRGFAGIVENYTDSAPIELADPAVDEADYAAAKTRIDAFAEAIQNGQPADPLVLTADDINAYIQYDPNWEFMKDSAVVSIEDNLISAQMSASLAKISEAIQFPGMGILQGRYFNGTADFDVFMRDGILYAHLVDLSINNEPVPEEFTMEMRKQNLAEEFNKGHQYGSTLQKIDSVEIADNQVTIIPRSTVAEPGGAPEPDPVPEDAGAPQAI